MIFRAVENFKRFDLFGCDIRLLTEGQPAYRTSLGATSTFIIFGVLIYALYSFILEMNKGKNALLNQKEMSLQQNEGFTFNTSDFMFSAGLLDNSGQVIPNDNNTIFTITFYVCTKFLDDTTCDYVPSVICGDRLDSAIQDLGVSTDYKYITYCMNDDYITSNPTLRLQGNERQDNFSLVGIMLQKCDNSTDSNCASSDTVNTYLTNSNFYYAYTFYQFNKELDDFPYEKTYSLDITPLYPNVRKYIKVLYEYSQAEQQYNPFYFFPNNYDYDSVEYSSTIVDTALNYNYDNLMAQVEVSLIAKKKLSYITFQTLMDVCAKIGGFFTILRVLFQILLFPFQVIMYKIYLINSLIKKTLEHSRQLPQNKQYIQISIFQLLYKQEIREFFNKQSKKIDSFLDVVEVLFNPVRVQANMEDIQTSIKRFETDRHKDNQYLDQGFDEVIGNIKEVQSKNVSDRSINDEIPVAIFSPRTARQQIIQAIK